MKKYLYETETRSRGTEFIDVLQRAGYAASIGSDAFRNYVVKITVSHNGTAIGCIKVYYKPSKKAYTLDLSEIRDNRFKENITVLWNGGSSELALTDVQDDSDIEYHAYVDGSYMKGKTGFGLVIVKRKKVIHEESGVLKEKEELEQRQVPGEIEGVRRTVAWCKRKGVDAIAIAYDYMGLEKWATGEWKTNNRITRNYADEMKKCTVKIYWKKIKSHSGDVWNDYADNLAKQAIDG
jgi:ribonuclease H-related protein